MSYVSTILGETGLVGFWEHAEPSGTTATDQTGNSNGTYTAAGVTLAQTGLPGGGGLTAVRFTAASAGFCTIPIVVASVIADVWSVELWVKRASTGSQYLFGSHTNSIVFYFTAGGAIQFDKEGVSAIVTSTGTITDTTTFHHIVVTKNGATVKQYIDAVDVTGTVTNSTFGNSSGNYFVGTNSNGGASSTQNGTMAMTALYKAVALSSAQVANHYTLGSAAAAATHGGFFGLMSKAHREWDRRRSGILVPRLWTPEPTYSM